MKELKLIEDVVFVRVMDYIKKRESVVLKDIYTDLGLDSSLVVNRVKIGLKYELLIKEGSSYSVNKKGIEGLMLSKMDELVG